MPVFVCTNGLMESGSFLAGVLAETSQQAFRRKNAMHSAWTASYHIGIQHHVRQTSITIERMIEMKLDDRLLLSVSEPMVSWHLCIMLIGFAVASSPLAESATVDLSPREDFSLRYFGLLSPRADGIDNLIADVMGNPTLL